MRILDRYAIKELVTHLFFGVAMFSAILMGASILPQIVGLFTRGGNAGEILEIFLLSVPAIVVVTFPMAMLLAALMGIGRLSSESELVAILASGISLGRIAFPVLMMAGAVGVLDFGFQEAVVPLCREQANRLVERIQARSGTFTDQAIFFQYPDPSQGPPQMLVGASKFQVAISGKRHKVSGGTLKGLKVVLLNKDGAPSGLVYAESAQYNRLTGRWDLTRMRAFRVPTDPAADKLSAPLMAQGAWFDFGKPPEDITRPPEPPEEMKIGKLRQAIKTLSQRGLPIGPYAIELHHRFSVPFAAIVFAMIGVPLGLRRQRTGSSLGMGLSVLIIFVYYIVWNYLRSMAKGNGMDPFLAAWIPNLAGLAIGTVLLQRAPK